MVVFMMFLFSGLPVVDSGGPEFSLMFWNVENFFADKPHFRDKCNGIAKTIFLAADEFGALPDIIGLAEVENRKVVESLVNRTNLRKASYGIVHYDSPDRRGIDCALLYRRSRFHLLFSKPCHLYDTLGRILPTRDILLVVLDPIATGAHRPSATGKGPVRVPQGDAGTGIARPQKQGPAANMVYPGEAVETPVVCIPVFPGTNCDYDTAKAFRKAGAEVRPFIFRNLAPADVLASIDELSSRIDDAHILAFCGGFSSGDEPDGSGKFIADVINNAKVGASITALLERGGLILGICNGFQALVKSGLLPYGRLGYVTPKSPTLFRNDINRHISLIATTEAVSVKSPWLSSFEPGERHSIAFSHGEGKFVVNDELARELFENGQVAFRYVDNPNGSSYDIEGILSPDGHILGKMGHSERYEDNLFKNISGNCRQQIFENAVNYFKKI